MHHPTSQKKRKCQKICSVKPSSHSDTTSLRTATPYYCAPTAPGHCPFLSCRQTRHIPPRICESPSPCGKSPHDPKTPRTAGIHPSGKPEQPGETAKDRTPTPVDRSQEFPAAKSGRTGAGKRECQQAQSPLPSSGGAAVTPGAPPPWMARCLRETRAIPQGNFQYPLMT